MEYNLKNRIVSLYYKSQFMPNFLSIFINPNFIVRTGLYDGIKTFSSTFHGKILDFGCGRMPYKKMFYNCNTYTGLDIQLEDKFNKHLFADIYYDGKILPFNDNTFDNIISFDVLQLIDNPEDILLEINRVLKNGGYFLVTVPFVWIEHWDNYDLCRYTVHGIEKLLLKNGFSIEDKAKTTNYFETLLQMFIAFLTYEIFPTNKKLRLFFVFIFITPLNLLGLFLRFIKINNTGSFYNNAIILAKKTN